MPFSPEDIKAAVAEFTVTTLFVFLGTMSAATSGDIGSYSLAFGFGIAVLVNAVGDVSGGHINPWVTVALAWTKNIEVPRAGLYIVAQLAGGVLGAAFTRGALGDFFSGGRALNLVNPAFSNGEALFGEALFTALLIFVVFSVAIKHQPTAGAGAIAPLYIGITVSIAHFALGNVTGCSINFARTFGPALIQNTDQGWEDMWVFFVGGLLGAVLGPLFFYGIFQTFTPDTIDAPADNNYDVDGASARKKAKPSSSNDNVAAH
jgi:MIP family channel proteins